MSILYETEGQAVIAAGYDGEIMHLQIPEEIGGLPVRRTAPWAFANRTELLTVSLPSSLRQLERFTFYSCRNLQKVLLYDGITDLGDGVFRQCRSLRDLELHLEYEQYGILREILSDTDSCMRFMMHLPDGQACLTFPEYLAEYEEDTRARAMHYHIEGIGFAFRECVSRSGIDFRGYDRLFSRIRMLDARQAAQIALDRLLYPYELADTAACLYEQYLRENACAVIRQVVGGRHLKWLTLLTSRRLLDQEAVEAGIRLASGMKNTEFVSILMNAAPPRSAGTAFTL